jgi:hypothetical protein
MKILQLLCSRRYCLANIPLLNRRVRVIGYKPLETHDHNFFFQLNTGYHSPYVTSSNESMGLSSAVVAGPQPAQSFWGSIPPGLMAAIYTIRFEGEVPEFISPRNRVAQLHPQALSLLNCSASYFQDNSSARTTQNTLHFYCCRRIWNNRGADHIEDTVLLL